MLFLNFYLKIDAYLSLTVLKKKKKKKNIFIINYLNFVFLVVVDLVYLLLY